MPNNKKSRIEQFVINKVKEIRTSKGFSQEDIARFLDTTRGFIGQIESLKHTAKYNINHLNTLADEMGVSIKDFFPEKPLLEIKRKVTRKK